MGLISKAIEGYVQSNTRQWQHDRRQTIGASEIGQCARKVFCLKFEDDPQRAVARNPGFVDGWGARERGNLIERHLLVPAIRKAYGDLALFLGEQQQTFFDGFLSCTPDCILLYNTDQNVLLEFKTIDPRVQLTEPKPEHVYQVQMQMGVLNALDEYPCDKAIISYTDASFLSETKEFEINYDPSYYDAAKIRAAMILTAGNFRELRPEGWIAGGKECEHCPFSIPCGHARRDVPEVNTGEVDAQFLAEMHDLALDYESERAVKETTEIRLRELQDDIKTRLRDKNMRRVVADGFSIAWSEIKPRELIDGPKLRDKAAAAGIDVAPFVRMGEGGDRLVVTVK